MRQDLSIMVVPSSKGINQSVSISSLLYSKVHTVLIYVCGVGKDYFSKCKGVQATRLK